uniref:Uncharacterized protein n=1 Tax=Oryza glumipatula TaxID=40148 RepID=A0A0E0BU73_9ORYZ
MATAFLSDDLEPATIRTCIRRARRSGRVGQDRAGAGAGEGLLRLPRAQEGRRRVRAGSRSGGGEEGRRGGRIDDRCHRHGVKAGRVLRLRPRAAAPPLPLVCAARRDPHRRNHIALLLAVNRAAYLLPRSPPNSLAAVGLLPPSFTASSATAAVGLLAATRHRPKGKKKGRERERRERGRRKKEGDRGLTRGPHMLVGPHFFF